MTVKQLQGVRELELISYYISLRNHIKYEHRLAKQHLRSGNFHYHDIMIRQVSMRYHLLYLIIKEIFDRRKN